MFKKRLRNFWLTILMLWRMLHPILRGLLIALVAAYLLILILSPERGFWVMLCIPMLLLMALSGFAIYLLLKEIK